MRRRNLVYVNTGRTKKDGTTDEKAHERKLKWDEENRLLASDDDGFVTNYWYDADGERTVKTSGESEQVYVNSEFAGGRTNTAKFSLYVSPYLVANQGGRYTKHIYIGSQRIVSKIGDFASYGSDPRRIQYAGSEADAVSVDYAGKYSAQQEAIKENYATFDVPYNGTDNNDYVNGEGFCCDDGSMEAAQTRAMAKALEDNFQEGDAYENLQFYYHSDHLGSSNYITNLDGEVVQHVEYVPFGEVFIEERNNIWNTPYLFNAKEFDEETGLYYYGARYYDPKLSLWISADPLSTKYPFVSGYCYLFNKPIVLIDPYGLEGWPPEWWTRSNMGTRLLGSVQMVGGAFEMIGSGIGTYVSGGTASPLSVPIFLNGIDNLQAGFKQLWTGKTQQTLLYSGIRSTAVELGLEEQTAEYIAAGIDISTILVGNGKAIMTIGGLKLTPKEVNAYAKIGSTGTIGENALKLLGGKSQQSFKTTLGIRRVDQFVNGVAHESKVGYTTLTPNIKQQVMKDAELLKNQSIDDAVWHFFKSPVTNKVGPSKPLLKELERNNIKVIIHE